MSSAASQSPCSSSRRAARRAQSTDSYGYSYGNPVASFRITRNGLELIRP